MDRQLAPEVNEALNGRWEPVYRSQLHYLITWSTRGRRPVLKERHIAALRGLVEQACEERGFSLLDVAAGPDHAHLLIALKPSQSVASVVREIKGRTGMAMVQQHPELRVWLRGNLLWDERYAVETVSPLRLGRVRHRLHTLHGTPEDLAEAS